MSKTRDIRKVNATDVVFDAGLQGDAFPRIEVHADGTIWTGDGTATPDTEVGATPPLITSGEPTDGDFDLPPPNGTIAIDGDADVAYYRKAGVWTPIGVPAAPTEPGAPGIGTATGGDTTATINWTAGTTGGSPITGYEVTLYLDADDSVVDTQTVGLVLTLQFTGLTNGAGVYGKVAAINAVGTGPQSAASNVVTPDVPPPFDPASLGSKLKVWLEGEDLSVGAISAWASRSPATVNASQGTGGAQPAGVAAQINGLTIARFVTDDFLSLGTTTIISETTGSEYTVFYVAKVPATFVRQWVIARDDETDGRDFAIGKEGAIAPRIQAAGNLLLSGGTVSDNFEYHTVDAVAGGLHKLYVNGVETASGSPSGVGSAATGSTDIGRRSYATVEDYATMDLAALYICNPRCDAGELASMHAYIADRFAL